MTDPAPPEERPPAGWYPDPGGEPRERFWDGERWTEQLREPWRAAPPSSSPPSSPPSVRPERTSGWAIASLITGVLGAFVLAVVLGIVARRRIRASGGRLGGDGLAIAGMVLGAAWGVVGIVLVVLAGTDALRRENQDDFRRGAEAEIALVVDRLEDAFDRQDGREVCEELLTPGFATRVGAASGQTCRDFVAELVPRGARQVDLDIERVRVVGDRADVRVEEGGDAQRWRLVRTGGRWRVDAIS